MKPKGLILFLAGMLAGSYFTQPAPSLATASSSYAQTRRDGNWWLRQDDLYKTTYLVGFIDGERLGNTLTFHLSAWTNASSEHFKALSKNFFDNEKKYLSDVTVGQINDGLSEFYKDYRNRRIETEVAVWLVLRSISGESKADIEKNIELYRKDASQY